MAGKGKKEESFSFGWFFSESAPEDGTNVAELAAPVEEAFKIQQIFLNGTAETLKVASSTLKDSQSELSPYLSQ